MRVQTILCSLSLWLSALAPPEVLCWLRTSAGKPMLPALPLHKACTPVDTITSTSYSLSYLVFNTASLPISHNACLHTCCCCRKGRRWRQQQQSRRSARLLLRASRSGEVCCSTRSQSRCVVPTCLPSRPKGVARGECRGENTVSL